MVGVFLLCYLQGQLSDMEPSQDDVCPSAVLRPAGPGGGGLYGHVHTEHMNIGLGYFVAIKHFLDMISQGLMQSCNNMHAVYLFQQDKHYDLSYDTGDKALQCGRHVDIFKLWLMWRAKVTGNVIIFP